MDRFARAFFVTLAAASAVAAGLGPSGLATASAAGVKVDLLVGGGTVVDYSSASDTGNAFGGAALVGISDFAIGVGVATALPDSRTQGQFTAVWVEGRYYPLGRDLVLQPYGVIGFGAALGDGFIPGSLAFEPARWSSATGPLGMLGVGGRYGGPTGAFIAADVRAWNLGHLGLALSVGYTF